MDPSDLLRNSAAAALQERHRAQDRRARRRSAAAWSTASSRATRTEDAVRATAELPDDQPARDHRLPRRGHHRPRPGRPHPRHLPRPARRARRGRPQPADGAARGQRQAQRPRPGPARRRPRDRPRARPRDLRGGGGRRHDGHPRHGGPHDDRPHPGDPARAAPGLPAGSAPCSSPTCTAPRPTAATSPTRAAGCGCARAPTRSRSPSRTRHCDDVDTVLRPLPQGAHGRRGLPDGRQPRPAAHRDRRRAGRATTGATPDSYEYQMLYGIRPDEQKRIADRGHQMRVYIPYGEEWYGYLMRRMAERPANTMFFLRAAGHDGRELTTARHTHVHGNGRDLRRRRHGGDPALRAAPGRAQRRRPRHHRAPRRTAPPSCAESYGVRVLEQRRGGRRRRHPRPRRQAAGHGRPARARSATTSPRATSSSASPPASRPTYLESRLPEGGAGRAGHAQHPGARRPGDGRRQRRRSTATPRTSPRPQALLRSCGKVLEVAEKHQDAVTAISGSGPGLHLLRRRGDDRGRRRARACRGPPRPSSSSRRCSAPRR